MATTFTTNYGFDKPDNGDTGWGTLRNANMDDLDAELSKPRIIQAAVTWGATTTLDLATSRIFTGTNTQVTTLAFTNVPATFPNGAIVPFVLWRFIVTNGGAFAITYPAAVTWLQGVAPTLQSSGVDELVFFTRDGGTTVYGLHRGKNLSISGVLKSQLGASTSQAKPSQVLFQAANVSTGSAGEVSITSYSLPANALSANGNAVRIIAVGNYGAGAGSAAALVKFGATTVATEAISPSTSFRFEVVVSRLGATSQKSASIELNNATLSGAFASPAETLSGAVTIDFRGNVGTGSAITFDAITVELLTV